MRECAKWLGAHLKQIGVEQVQIVATKGHPIVLGQWCHLPGQATLLIYGHYDVQPAEPLDEWSSPPFEPEVHGGNLYGREACDDKGQLFAHVKGIEACLRTRRTLPVNVKCLFEGEEEIGAARISRRF